MGPSTKKIKIMPLLCNAQKFAYEGLDASWTLFMTKIFGE
jgi:hypothetical protein